MSAEALGADGSLFEALFRVEAPSGALLTAITGLGVEPARLAPRYPSTTWVRTLELYRAHLFPSLPEPEGNRRLGAALARGFGQTLSGALVLATLPLFSPQRLLRSWPRLVRMGRTDVSLHVTDTGPRSADLHSIDPVGVPAEINLGLLDFAFEHMKVRANFVLEPISGATEVVVHVTW